jgi:superfamily II DNA or RNA helicase
MNNPRYEHLPLFDDILRCYQKGFISGCRASFRAGHKAVIGILPTGMGKTTATVCMPKEGARVMVICQQDNLVKQWAGTIRHLRRQVADIEQAFNKADAGTGWIVATWQTLQSNERFRRFIGQIDLIIVDECDSFFSKTAREILKEFIEGGARVLGITATPFRSKKKESLFGFYTDCGYSMELRDAFKLAYLVEPLVTVHRVESVSFAHLSKNRVDYAPDELDRILTSEQVLHDLAALANRVMVERFNVMFCNSVRQSILMRDMMQERHGVKTSLVYGTQNEEERAAEMAAFKAGESRLIVNCRVLGRGVDIPEVRCIINGRPTKSKATYMQMLGRGTRALPGVLDGLNTVEERAAAIAASGKPNWHLHDITSTSRYHQPITAIDILMAGPKELIDKIKDEDEGGEEQTLEELDADIQAAIDEQKELERLEREAERERRKQLVVGVTFDSRSRDLFARPDAKTPTVRGFRVPFGRWRGRPLRDPVVPLSYLQWMLREGKLNAMWSAAVKQEVDRREAVLAEESVGQW